MIPIINGKTTVYDLAVDSLYHEDCKRFRYIFNLFVKANTNTYHFTMYAMKRLILEGYNPDLFDVRNLKLFRKSLAKFLKKGKLEFNKI